VNRIIIWLFILICGHTYSQNITQAEYYFDTDPGEGNGTAITITPDTDIVDQIISINTSTLSNGVHNLNLRTKDENGQWSHTQQRQILLNPLLSSSEIVAAEYFINTDPGEGNGTAISITPNSEIPDQIVTINISALPKGVHNLSLRTKDENGKWSHTHQQKILLSPLPSSSEIIAAEYFFDIDPGEGNGNSINITPSEDIIDKSVLVSTNTLANGIHTLYVRSQQMNGEWSLNHSTTFLKNIESINKDIVQLEYFWNTDPGQGLAEQISISQANDIIDITSIISTSELEIGSHALNIRAKDEAGTWSLVNVSMIVKLNASEIVDITKLEYFWDIDPGIGLGNDINVTQSEDISNKVISISTTSLAVGIHQLSIRSKNENGKWSLTNSKPIYKAPNNAIKDIVELEYFFDIDPGKGMATQIAITENNDVVDITKSINPAGLTEGIHYLYVRSKGSSGKWSHINHKSIYVKSDISIKNITYLEFYWNEDPGLGNGQSISVPSFAPTDNVSNLIHTFDISGLANGVQILNIRSKDETGQWSHTYQEVINVYNNPKGDIVLAEYFFNEDPGYGQGSTFDVDTLQDIDNQALTIDISSIDLGIHHLHVRYQTENGKWTQDEITKFLYRDGQLYTLAEGEYFIDIDPGLGMATPFNFTASTDAADFNILIFANDIDPGLHNLYVRTKNANGQWSLTNVKFDIEFENTLPLNLLTFKVRKKDKNALLEWTVNNAINTSHFEVEKDNNREFIPIGKVNSENTLEERSYTFLDEKTHEKWNYYRLKQVDQDGAFEYSEVRSVYFDSELSLSVYPNPTIQTITIHNLDSQYEYELFNSALQKIQEGTIDQEMQLDISQLVDGNYHLIIKKGAEVHRFMIVKI
jgi:hypothetical protein